MFNASKVLAFGLGLLLPSVLFRQDNLTGCIDLVRANHDFVEALVVSSLQRRQGLLIADFNLMDRSPGFTLDIGPGSLEAASSVIGAVTLSSFVGCLHQGGFLAQIRVGICGITVDVPKASKSIKMVEFLNAPVAVGAFQT